MMKKVSYLLVLSVIVMFSCFASAKSVIRLNYKGTIKPGTCNIETKVSNVELGTWFLNKEDSGRMETDWVQFELDFNCKQHATQIIGAFQGAASANAHFAIDQTADSAKGIEIELESYSPTGSRWVKRKANEIGVLLNAEELKREGSKLKLRARYSLLTKKPMAGDANASITLVIQNN
ncbi:fimbrial protein [Providencia rettgeri]|nr:type 1 fimbrial protein [Providencia rettgeri]